MTDQELRDAIDEATILANCDPPDDRHASWWLNPDASAHAVLAVFEPEIRQEEEHPQ